MSLSDIVNVQITRATVFPTRVGFGVNMIVAYHTLTPNRVDYYSSLAGVVAAGFASPHPVYKAAVAAFSQNPSPTRFAVGKRLLPTTQVVTLQPIITTQGLHYPFNFVDKTGLVTAIDWTNGASESPTTIATGIQALLPTGGSTGVTVTRSTDTITIASATAGAFFDLTGLPPLLQMKVKNTSADPGIATDLNAISAVDAQTWYAFTLESNSKAEILAAAAWAEATRHFHYAQCSDSEIADNAVTTDLMSGLKAAAYARTGLMFAQNRLNGFRAWGLAAHMSTITPGASTWEYQTIAGDTVDAIDDGSIAKLWAKGCATYTTIAGLNVTQNVKVGDGEFADLIPGTDKLFADIQFNVFADLAQASASGSKIAYTDKGVGQIVNDVSLALTAGVTAGFLSNNPAPTVSAPKVATIDAATKSSRNLPNVTFSATLSGAIHSTQIKGTLVP